MDQRAKDELREITERARAHCVKRLAEARAGGDESAATQLAELMAKYDEILASLT